MHGPAQQTATRGVSPTATRRLRSGARRDPQKTRRDLLQAAADEIYHHGFQAASMDAILCRAGVTKGALYHHFGSKLDLGYAVLDEVFATGFTRVWVSPLLEHTDPIDGFRACLSKLDGDGLDSMIRHGCPLNNLAQEMADIEPGFQQRVEAVFCTWQAALREAFERGKKNGSVRQDVEPAVVATFLVSACQGSIGLAKSCQCGSTLARSLTEFQRYLESLRP